MWIVQWCLFYLAAGSACFPLSVEELEDDYSTTDGYEETTSETTSTVAAPTTVPWNFDDYTSKGSVTTATIIQDEIIALRKVAQILLLLGEQVIPNILGDPPINRCEKKKLNRKEIRNVVKKGRQFVWQEFDSF